MYDLFFSVVDVASYL